MRSAREQRYGEEADARGAASGREATVTAEGLPEWLAPVARAAATIEPRQLSRFLPPEGGGRQSAVLILFGHGPRGPELLLMERAGIAALARRPALLPRRRPRPGGRRSGRARSGAGGAARGRGGDRSRPVRCAGLRRAAAALHPRQRLRGDARPGVVAPAEPGRRGRPGGDRPGLHGSRGGSHGPGPPCDHASIPVATPGPPSLSRTPWSGALRPESSTGSCTTPAGRFRGTVTRRSRWTGARETVSGVNVLDILLLVAAVWFAIIGYRQGFVVGILSVIGFLGGGLIAVYLLPVIWNEITGRRRRPAPSRPSRRWPS